MIEETASTILFIGDPQCRVPPWTGQAKDPIVPARLHPVRDTCSAFTLSELSLHGTTQPLRRRVPIETLETLKAFFVTQPLVVKMMEIGRNPFMNGFLPRRRESLINTGSITKFHQRFHVFPMKKNRMLLEN